MAKSRKKKQKDEEIIYDITKAKSSMDEFLEVHQTKLMIGVGLLFLLVAAFFAYKYLYQAPREKEAMSQIFQAEIQFQQDSFALALNNPGGGFDGFVDIVDEYSGTKTANLARYYAGVCYLNLGRYDDAIQYMGDFSAGGNIVPAMKYGVLGDAYSEKGEVDNALLNYEKAAYSGENDLINPYYMKKLGMLYKRNGNAKEANKVFHELKEKYPTSAEAQDIEKFIS